MPQTAERREREREAVPFDPNVLLGNITTGETRWAQTTLPIAQDGAKTTITNALTQHNSIVLEADPGSGKSTIAPVLFLKEIIQNNPDARIVVTQPRRLATESVAQYIGKEIGSEFVDYRYKGHPLRKPHARLEFTVEQSLLNDLMTDETLEKYEIVMIDEVHERSITIDTLLPLLKRAQAKRAAVGHKPLKLVFASATLDANALSEYFKGAHKVHIEGQPHEVTEHFSAEEIAPEDVMQKAADKASELLADPAKTGDMLIFMPGKAEIDKTIELIGNRTQDAEIVTIMGGDQDGNPYEKINNNPGNKRRIYIATDAAETSITIPKITMVIDSGLMRKMEYDAQTRMTTLVTLPHTKANWKQRSRRAGRTQKGEAYALFTKAEYEKRDERQVAEFMRSDLTPQILKMKALGIDNVHNFDYIEHPGNEIIDQAIESLQKLGALDEHGKLTAIGVEMNSVEDDPHFARMLVEAKKRNCLDQVVLLIAYMKARGPLYNFNPRREAFSAKYQSYIDPSSDFLTFLNVWNDYQTNGIRLKPSEQNGESLWQTNGFNRKTLAEISKERKNLLRDGFFQDVNVSGREGVVDLSDEAKQAINISIASGLVDKILVRDAGGTYKFSNGTSSNILLEKSSVITSNPRDMFMTGKIHSKTKHALANMAFEPSMLAEFPYLAHVIEQQAEHETVSHAATDETEQAHINEVSPVQVLASEPAATQHESSHQTFFQHVQTATKNFFENIKKFFTSLGKKLRIFT